MLYSSGRIQHAQLEELLGTRHLTEDRPFWVADYGARHSISPSTCNAPEGAGRNYGRRSRRINCVEFRVLISRAPRFSRYPTGGIEVFGIHAARKYDPEFYAIYPAAP